MSDAHEIKCLEVWGGTRAVETALALPGIDAWVYSLPYAGDVEGGDIHYVSSCFTGRVARFAVADVSGHGAHASRLAGTLRGLMRKHINFLDQTGLARVLNQEFAELGDGSRFATAVLLSYFAPTDHLIICNAGHPRPLWRQAATGRWLALDHALADSAEVPSNLPLGVIEPTEYVQFTVRLAPDDLVLIYTDWLIEAQAPGGAQLGEEGLLELVRALPAGSPEQIGRALLTAMGEYRGGKPADDDQTIVVLHHNAGEVPRRPVRHAIRAMAGLLGLAGD